MTIIPVFRDIKQPPEPWTAEISDIVREKWFVGIPRHLRKPRREFDAEALKRGHMTSVQNGIATGAIRAAKTKAERAALAGDLRKLLDQGIPLYRAAQSLGMGWMRAKRIAVEHGFEPAADQKSRAALAEVKKTTRPDPASDRDEVIRAMIEEGLTNIEISNATGITLRSLDRRAKKMGLPSGQERAAALNAARNAKIIAMSDAGHDWSEIGARFGLSKDRVRKIIGGLK